MTKVPLVVAGKVTTDVIWSNIAVDVFVCLYVVDAGVLSVTKFSVAGDGT